MQTDDGCRKLLFHSFDRVTQVLIFNYLLSKNKCVIVCTLIGHVINRTHMLTNKFVFDNSSSDHYNYKIR